MPGHEGRGNQNEDQKNHRRGRDVAEDNTG